MTTLGYIREQLGATDTAEAQERTLTDYATKHGLTLDRVHVERRVAGRVRLETRPEGGKLVAGLKPGDVLITPSLAGLFNSAKAAMEGLTMLWAHRVSIHIIDLGGNVSDGGSKTFGAVLKAFTDLEHNRDRERSVAIKSSERKKGKYLGGNVPAGYRVDADGQIVENPKTREAISKAKALRQQGQSLRAVAAILKANGINLSHETLRKLTKR